MREKNEILGYLFEFGFNKKDVEVKVNKLARRPSSEVLVTYIPTGQVIVQGTLWDERYNGDYDNSWVLNHIRVELEGFSSVFQYPITNPILKMSRGCRCVEVEENIFFFPETKTLELNVEIEFSFKLGEDDFLIKDHVKKAFPVTPENFESKLRELRELNKAGF